VKEREISLIDLIFYILLRWRAIVAAMLIGAVVLAGFGFVRSNQSYEAQVQQVEEAKKELEEEMAELEKELAKEEADKEGSDKEEMPDPDKITKKWLEKELKETQIQNIHSVLLYEQQYEDALARLKDNVWMQADSNLIYKAELTFKVTAATVERTNNIERVYEDAVVSGELKEKLADALKSSTAAVGDIYSFARGTGSLAEGGDTFRVSVSHYDEAVCEKLAKIIKEFVDEKCVALQGSLGSHEIAVVNESVAEITDTGLWNYQNQYYRDLMNQKNNIENMKNAFGLYELQYYDILANGKFTKLTEEALEEYEKVKAEEAEAEEATKEAEAIAAAAEAEAKKAAALEDANSPASIVARGVTVTPGISLKYIILGMILGAFVLVFWFFVLYIINSKLRATDNLQRLYGIPQLGSVDSGKADKKWFGFVDKWIISLRDYNKRKFTSEEALELAAVAVKMAAGKAGLDTVYVIGCDLKGSAMELSERLKGRLAKENIHVEILSNILYDAQAMCDLEKAQGVVLLETADSTLYTEIARELELLGRQDIRVLGGIIAG